MADREKFMRNYYRQHWCCPECGSRSLEFTLAAYGFDEDHPENYKDRNYCKCNNCGWRGIFHELSPKPGIKDFKDKLKEIVDNGYSEELADELLDIANDVLE